MIQETLAPDTPSVVETLREQINLYLGKHPNITVQTLAQRSMIPVTTMRRVLQQSVKTEIAPHNVLNICSYIYRERNIAKLLTLLPENISVYLKKHFGQFVFSDQERTYSTDLNLLLKDRMNYFIYKLAANHQGVSLMDVTEIFGSIGKKKADELAALGVLIKDENGQLHAKDKNFSLDLETATSHLPELVKFYKPHALAQGKNLMYSLSESLNEAAIVEIKNIQREAVKKIHHIMNTSENFGSIPYFTLNLAETFLVEEEGVLQ